MWKSPGKLPASLKPIFIPLLATSYHAGGGSAGNEALKVGGGIEGGAVKAYGTLNWEIDIWGKIRHANMAAYSQFIGDIENRNGLIVSLVSEVAQLYFLLRDLDNRLMIAQKTLVARKESTRIITERFNKGLCRRSRQTAG